MKTGLAVVGFVVVALVVGTCVACTTDDDNNSLGHLELVSHEYGDGGDQDYDQWDSDQRNHNRRNRGAFSPGPFTDSPVDAFNGNTVCLPGSTCYADRREEPPPEERR